MSIETNKKLITTAKSLIEIGERMKYRGVWKKQRTKTIIKITHTATSIKTKSHKQHLLCYFEYLLAYYKCSFACVVLLTVFSRLSLTKSNFSPC